MNATPLSVSKIYLKLQIKQTMEQILKRSYGFKIKFQFRKTEKNEKSLGIYLFTQA